LGAISLEAISLAAVSKGAALFQLLFFLFQQSVKLVDELHKLMGVFFQNDLLAQNPPLLPLFGLHR
jgi:hypothetical protein